MTQLIAILIAIIVGYSCRHLPFSMNTLNRVLSIAIIIILLIMGYEFGGTAGNLIKELYVLSKIVAIFVVSLFILNVAVVSLVCKKYARSQDREIILHSHGFLYYLKSSGKYLIYVFAGILLGYYLNIKLPYVDYTISLILLLVLFIIGYQLRAQNIALKSLLLNKEGLLLSLAIVTSSTIAGVIGSFIAGVSVKTGIVLSSGFGWYTLSGILTGQLINQHMGTAAFFIDFMREILSLLLIPLFGVRYPAQAIGYAGATALDFTLPVIKETIGADKVPLAITSGMILSVLVPLLIPIFWQL